MCDVVPQWMTWFPIFFFTAVQVSVGSVVPALEQLTFAVCLQSNASAVAILVIWYWYMSPGCSKRLVIS